MGSHGRFALQSVDFGSKTAFLHFLELLLELRLSDSLLLFEGVFADFSLQIFHVYPLPVFDVVLVHHHVFLRDQQICPLVVIEFRNQFSVSVFKILSSLDFVELGLEGHGGLVIEIKRIFLLRLVFVSSFDPHKLVISLEFVAVVLESLVSNEVEVTLRALVGEHGSS